MVRSSKINDVGTIDNPSWRKGDHHQASDPRLDASHIIKCVKGIHNYYEYTCNKCLNSSYITNTNAAPVPLSKLLNIPL